MCRTASRLSHSRSKNLTRLMSRIRLWCKFNYCTVCCVACCSRVTEKRNRALQQSSHDVCLTHRLSPTHSVRLSHCALNDLHRFAWQSWAPAGFFSRGVTLFLPKVDLFSSFLVVALKTRVFSVTANAKTPYISRGQVNSKDGSNTGLHCNY